MVPGGAGDGFEGDLFSFFVQCGRIQCWYGCWAYGTIAAAEISYLFENNLGTPAGTPNNNIDLSEKDFAWYYYHGITADDST